MDDVSTHAGDAFKKLLADLESGDLAAAQAAHAELRLLAETHPDQAETQLILAKAGVNLLGYLAEAEQLGQAEEIFKGLVKLASGKHGCPELRLRQAQGGFNLLDECVKQQSATRARTIYTSILHLAKANAEELELQEPVARAISILLKQRKEAADVAGLLALLGDLASLVETFPKEPGWRASLAKESIDLLLAAAQNGRLDEVIGLYHGVRDLARNHPGEPAVLQQFARAVVFLMFFSLHQEGGEDAAKNIFADAAGLQAPPLPPDGPCSEAVFQQAIQAVRDQDTQQAFETILQCLATPPGPQTP